MCMWHLTSPIHLICTYFNSSPIACLQSPVFNCKWLLCTWFNISVPLPPTAFCFHMFVHLATLFLCIQCYHWLAPELWSWKGAETFQLVEPEPKPEIWVPIPQTKFVGQASCTNNTMIFSFQWTKLFWSQSQKLLDFRAGAKNYLSSGSTTLLSLLYIAHR